VNDENYKAMKGSCCGIILSYYAGICLEGLKGTAKYLNQNSRSPHRDLNPNLPNMKQESLRRSVEKAWSSILSVRCGVKIS
jgi:hypothetical protein